MWLADDTANFVSGSSEQQEEKVKCGSYTPPLEGGESLCELDVESSELNERIIPLPSSADLNEDSLKLELPAISSNLQNELLPGPHDQKFPSRNFLSLIGQELLPANTFTQTFLQSILSSVDSKDPVVANAWMETLLDVIDLLPKEIIKRDILTLAVNKGQLSQSVSSRLLCCRLLGKICTKFDPYIIRKEILPVVLSLCQDVDFEVRGCMCRQLDVVAKGIGLETTKTAILPELVELANDEESQVRLAGIETVVHMLPMLDDVSGVVLKMDIDVLDLSFQILSMCIIDWDPGWVKCSYQLLPYYTCVQAIIPLVKKFCENSIRSEDSTLPVVARQLGRLCHGLANNFTAEQKQWFLKFYRELAKLGLPHHKRDISEMDFFCPMPDIVPHVDNQDRYRECRHACAYNFPAVSLFAGPENFQTELYETFSDLCSDPCHNVRRTMACGFYEITKQLGSQSPLLLHELVRLLKDDSLEVLKGLITHLPETLEAVSYTINSSEETKHEQANEIVKALLACEEATSVTSNWRLHADFLTRLSSLPQCLSSDIIYMKFVPLLFVKLHTARPIPCRIASAYSLLVFLRHTPRLEQRNGIINELIRELCYGRSCHKRMLFIRVCELIIELFSKAFFKQYFFKPLLGLADDPVPNIRLRLCVILPQLKALMKLPMDSHLLQELEGCVRRLMSNRKDKDVAAAVSKAIEELDKIEVSAEPSSRRTSCIEPEKDLIDMQKEEEEKQLLEMELKEKHSIENKGTNSPTTRSLGRQGKIPVRRSYCVSGGTLPKQLENREKKSISSRAASLTPTSSASIQAIKQERRISAPLSSAELKNHSRGTITNKESAEIACLNSVHNMFYSSLPKSSIPVCNFQSPGLRQSSKHALMSMSQKLPPGRCPSPMPLTADFLEQHQKQYTVQQSASRIDLPPLSSQLYLELPSPSREINIGNKLDEFPISSQAISSSNTVSEEHSYPTNIHQSEPKPKLQEMVFLSPETSRRSLSSSPSSSSPGSRIPTPTSSLRRRSTMGNS